jgi:flagellar biosynthesis GTPase FlhF
MTPNEARQILGVSSTATQDEIKQAWKDLAFSFHPDRAGVGNEARRKRLEEKLKEVNVAYDTLKSVTPKTKRTKKQTKKTKQTDREKNTDKTWKEYEEAARNRREKETEEREKQKAREEHDKQVRQRAEEERNRREKEKQAKQKRKAQIILLVVAVLSTIIITNPLNFGVNEISVPFVVVESPEPEPREPMPIGSLEPEPVPEPVVEPVPEPAKLELLPTSKFILTGNSGDRISDADCTIFERKFDLNQEDAIYFGRYDEFRCAKAIIVFDLADLQNKLLTEQAESKDNVISFEQMENTIEPLSCNGINLHPNDRQDTPNCNHTNDYTFELKFKFSNDSDCGPPNELFSELESWDKAVDWSNTTNNLNIYDVIVSELSTGQYLCLAFSEEGIDKTGDRNQYFRLYALADLKINVFFVDEDS